MDISIVLSRGKVWPYDSQSQGLQYTKLKFIDVFNFSVDNAALNLAEREEKALTINALPKIEGCVKCMKSLILE